MAFEVRFTHLSLKIFALTREEVHYVYEIALALSYASVIFAAIAAFNHGRRALRS